MEALSAQRCVHYCSQMVVVVVQDAAPPLLMADGGGLLHGFGIEWDC